MPLSPGLHLVATPIGSADDITLRALEILRSADIIAAEDTRRVRKLMEIHGVARAGRQILPYHDHNGPAQRPVLLAALREGRSVALVSDAGTPLIADPGYRLAAEAIAEGLPVTAAPGASAVLTALSLAGLPTDRFFFAGFPPPKAAGRRAFLAGIAEIPGTLVFYESPRRLAACLADMSAVLGEAREAAICRELTKKFEEVRRGTLGALAADHADAPPPKGEIVVVVGPPAEAEDNGESLDAALATALAENSLKDAAQIVAEALGLPRKRVYARALELRGGE